MCPNMNLFATYKPVKEDTVFVAHDHSWKVVGVGTIKITMFDGVVRTLSDAHHVPDLRRNLISLGALESKSCNNSIKDGILSV